MDKNNIAKKNKSGFERHVLNYPTKNGAKRDRSLKFALSGIERLSQILNISCNDFYSMDEKKLELTCDMNKISKATKELSPSDQKSIQYALRWYMEYKGIKIKQQRSRKKISKNEATTTSAYKYESMSFFYRGVKYLPFNFDWIEFVRKGRFSSPDRRN